MKQRLRYVHIGPFEAELRRCCERLAQTRELPHRSSRMTNPAAAYCNVLLTHDADQPLCGISSGRQRILAAHADERGDSERRDEEILSILDTLSELAAAMCRFMRS
jgi:hypothetical protein